ncbi:hypothetical protein ACFCYH_08005 [Streptomyces sp. NPDC056400]|uniref:hypothetical protein n=1 Tax=Streptomyces sp. NPDC056400 TaxID=3345808 RepID=UPI0035D7886C
MKQRVSPYMVRQTLASPIPPPRKERAAIEGRAKGRVGPVGPAVDVILDEYAATQQAFHANVLQYYYYRALLTAVRGEPARHGLDGSFSSMTVFSPGPSGPRS